MDTVTTKLQHMEHLIGQDYERVAEEEYADTIVIEQVRTTSSVTTHLEHNLLLSTRS